MTGKFLWYKELLDDIIIIFMRVISNTMVMIVNEVIKTKQADTFDS